MQHGSIAWKRFLRKSLTDGLFDSVELRPEKEKSTATPAAGVMAGNLIVGASGCQIG
jgi:hypothetical protein